MSEMSEREFEAAISPPSPGADTIESLRDVINEIHGDLAHVPWGVVAVDAAKYAGRLLADLDELAASLPRGQWGADELSTLANWLGEHGYDIGDED